MPLDVSLKAFYLKRTKPQKTIYKIVAIFVYTQKDMQQVTVKYKNTKALKALQDLATLFDMVIEKPSPNKHIAEIKRSGELPITFAKNPDVKALAGIWEGREISLEELRKEAWGSRI